MAFLAGLSALCRAQSLPSPPSERETLEAFLRRADIAAVDKETQAGRMNAWLVTLNDGKTSRRALFKYIRRNRPALMPDSYAYELAAYELDRLLGLELMPATVERSIEGRTGSLQVFFEDAESEKSRLRKNLRPPDPAAYQDRLDEILVLEHLVGAPRQDLGDIIYQTAAWRPWRVDFSEAFPPSGELLSEYALSRCSRRVLAALSTKWDDGAVRKRLKTYLTQAEIEALFKRRLLILNEVKRLVVEKGEAAVLYRP
ncbi:MAG: hypothetical protein A2Y86_02215 [Candidatus Aminicenantes bacterium RBG_13_62_12]|nr:MAG: hypothetical protein A2Y86_02215 [Candidatus Aminicenantes bacterium RBG_13_62_12]